MSACIRRFAVSPTTSLQFLSKLTRHPLSSSPFKPIRLTKKACISLLQTCKSVKQLKQVHSQILMSSLHRSRDVTDDLMAFLTDPQTGDLHYAQKVFDDMGDPSLFTYNLMIKALSKKGLSKSTLLLFRRMREENLSPDNFTYPFVMKAMGSLRMVSECGKTHALVVKSGFEFDPFVRNSLVDMYAEAGSVEVSRKLFDEMQVRDVISWNVLIAVYVKCRKFEEAIAVFRTMEKEGVNPDEGTLVSTLSACVPLGDLELGKKIHLYMNEEFRFSIPLGNALLDLYAKCGCVDLARRFFEDMPAKNVISWTTMVSGYVKSGRLDEARELFDRSPAGDVVLWTAMINGYAQYNRYEEALAMFREMQMRRIKPDRFTVATLLTICANLGALDQGKWIHGYIEDNKIRIDTVVGTALIDMYAKCGCIEKSIEVFRRVEGKDTATWTSIICGLAMNGRTGEALELFSEMERVGAEPDDITFIGVLSACSHGGLVGEGRRFLYAMKEVHQIEPKLEHYGCMVDLLGRAGLLDEAEGLIQSLPNWDDKDVLPLWGALLGACKIHGDVEMGGRVARKFADLESGNSGIHTLVANIYASAERWEDATRVRRKMRDVGIKKTPGCSSIQVNGVIREFLVGDTSCPETDEIYSVLNILSRVMDLEERVEI